MVYLSYKVIRTYETKPFLYTMFVSKFKPIRTIKQITYVNTFVRCHQQNILSMHAENTLNIRNMYFLKNVSKLKIAFHFFVCKLPSSLKKTIGAVISETRLTKNIGEHKIKHMKKNLIKLSDAS